MMKQVHETILAAIGGTPIVRLNRVAAHVASPIYVKCEFLNPGGSIKDRIGLAMLEAAEREGRISPGGTIIEATSGNTGMGLAVAAAVKGYRAIFVMPDKMSEEKIRSLRAFGATVVVTPTAVAPEDPRSYYSVARRLAQETPNAFYANQYTNAANPRAHYDSTGPEIWSQMAGEIDVFVAGMGTGGTISGCGRYLKERKPGVTVVGVDPEGSMYYDFVKKGEIVEPHTYRIEGIGEDFFPETMDFSVLDEVIRVADKESFLMTRRLLTEEGLFAGISSGAAVVGAIRYAESLPEPRTLLVILPDSGNRYLSKVYDDNWMREVGFLDPPRGRVRDVIGSASDSPIVITARLGETIGEVVRQMREHGISQLPVVDGTEVVGMIGESELIRPLLEGGMQPTDVIDSLVTTAFTRVAPSDPVDRLPEIFQRSHAAVVVENGVLRGIVTTIDLISYLSMHSPKCFTDGGIGRLQRQRPLQFKKGATVHPPPETEQAQRAMGGGVGRCAADREDGAA